MLLVVDANILFSFFKKGTLIRELIVNPDFKYNLQLVAPEKVLSELDKHKIEICKKAEIKEDEFEFPREVLEVFIRIIPDEFWQDCKAEAKKLLPEHVKDMPYLALALKLNCGVWSYDKNLRKQSSIKIYSTKELLEGLE